MRLCYAFVLFAFALGIADGNSQTRNLSVDEIVANYLKARGGAEKMRSYESLTVGGVYTYRGIEYPFKMTRARPNFVRLELKVQGKKVVVAFDGKTVWETDELRPTPPRPSRDIRSRTFVEALSDFDGAIVDFHAKGHRVAFAGQESVDGTPTYQLEVSLQSGRVENWFLDAHTFQILKRTTKVPDDDEVFEQSLYFMDYEDIDGFMIPQYIERQDGHRVKSYEIGNVEVNPQVDVTIFRMPN